MKRIGLIIVICLICVLSQISIKAQDEIKGFIVWDSKIITSENKQYILVLLANYNIDQRIKDVISGWKKVGFKKAELAEQKKPLMEDMQKERSIRQKYKVSGIFKNDSDTPIHVIKDFPLGLDSFVANDGSYVIGIQSNIPFSITANITREELLSTSKPALTSIVFNENNPTFCNAKVIDLVNEKYPVSPETDGFFWANSAVLNNDENLLDIQMLNGEKVSWDIKNCKLAEKPSQQSEKDLTKTNKEQSSICFSLTFIPFIIGYALAHR